MSDPLARVPAIVELLRGWLDFFPVPRLGSAEAKQLRGPAEGRKRKCGGGCNGTGKLRRGKHSTPCERCNGSGRVSIDPQLGAVVTAADAPNRRLRSMTLNELDGALSRLDQEERDVGYACERHQQRRELQPFYLELAVSMAALKTADRFAHGILVWVDVMSGQKPESLLPPMAFRRARGLVFVALDLPEEWEAPQWAFKAVENRANEAKKRLIAGARNKHGEQASLRNAIIRQQFADGLNVRALASEYALSERRIRQVLEEAA